MSKRIWRDFVILLGVFVIIWMFFTYIPVFSKISDLSISTENEEQIGKHMVDNLLIENGELDTIANPVINAFIDSVFYILEPNIENPQFNYKYIISNSMEVNAYALPGGYIVINAGLLKICDSPQEIIAVIAHEIGHIENRHLISRLIKKLGIAILISGDSSVIEEVSQTAITTVFDRKQEEEADQFAFKTLEKSGISPRIFAKFFRKMETEGLSYNKNFKLLMTHPHNDDRIKASLSYKIDNSFVEKPIDLDLLKVKVEISSIN